MSELEEPPTVRVLHPATLLFDLASVLWSALLPALVLVFGKFQGALVVFVVTTFALSVAHRVLRYFTLRWTMAPDELLVREGIFWKQDRRVPWNRLQNINVIQSPVHRLFGVAEVRVESAAGSDAEATLRVIRMDDVAALQARIHQNAPAAQSSSSMNANSNGSEGDAAFLEVPSSLEPTRNEEIIVQVPAKHIALLGLVANRGLAVVAGAFVLLEQANLIERALDSLPFLSWFQTLEGKGALGILMIVAVLAFVGGVTLVGLSVLWSLVKYHRFSLRLVDDELRVECGLWTRVTASLPRPRVQALLVHAPLFPRMLGFAAIQAQSASPARDKENVATVATSRLIPMLPENRVQDIVPKVLQDVTWQSVEWQSLAKGAKQRVRKRSLVIAGLLLAPAAIWLGIWGKVLFGLGLVFVGWFSGARVDAVGWATPEWGLAWKRGVINQVTTLLPGAKVQSTGVSESPFDRRHGHARLDVDVAGGNASAVVRISYLNRNDAQMISERLANTAASTEFRVGATEEGPISAA